jgi:hypothetical protein
MLNDKTNQLVYEVADALNTIDIMVGITEAKWFAGASLQFIQAVSALGHYHASHRHWKAAFQDLSSLRDEARQKIAAKEADFRKIAVGLANT